MNRWLLVAALLALAGVWLLTRSVEADHNEPPILPGVLNPSPVLAKGYQQGYLTYGFDAATASYPGFREQAARVAQRYQDALGIVFREAQPGETVDIWNVGPADSAFLTSCGQGAAACVDWFFHPAVARYRLALGFVNWESTITHEWGHILGQHEMYRDRGSIACLTDRTWTQMSCGTGVRGPQPFDRDTIWNITVPDAPCPRGFSVAGSWVTVSWGLERCDDGLAHYGKVRQENATRVAFGWSSGPGESIRWAGEFCGPAYGYCYTPYTAGSRGFDDFWRGCLFIRAENALTWPVPQVSAPGYWTWLGCW